MAITFIYPIKSTGEKSLDYDTENKSAKIIEKKENSKDSLDYIMRDKKGNAYKLSSAYLEKMKNYISYDDKNKQIVFHTIKSGLYCCVKNAYEEWKIVRQKSNNSRSDKGNLQYCIVQNFGIDLDPMVANKIGVEFAQKYLSDYQCVVSTHINTGYVHNHIEFNATSFVTGKKFNDNLKAIRDIRQVSDELCKKYELEVLEHTKDFNYIVYRDNGKTKVYEPTERKNQIFEGEFSNKNDYRNTTQFNQSKVYADTHLDELRKDIEQLLPYAVNYEDLLQQLRNAGYEIKDKTKNGEWRKYISFKAPTWDKFIRDKSLGENYERDNLKNIIEKQNKKIEKHQDNKMFDDVKKSDIYVYGRIVIEDIDDNYRYKKKKNTYEKVRRNDIEKYIIADVKKLNKELNKARYRMSFKPLERHVQELAEGTRKEQYLIDRINSNLRTLRFVEDREIKSFEQINDVVKILYEKRKACDTQLDMIDKALRRANADIVLIEKYHAIKKMVSDNEDNPSYIVYEKNNDMELIKAYENALKEKGLLGEERQIEFKEKYTKYNSNYVQLMQALEKINDDIREYDDCIFSISTVDKDNGNKYASQIETYYNTKKSFDRNINER